MLSRRKILVVDLSEDERKHLSDILEPEYEVVTACCGAAALRLLGRASFDLILMGRIGGESENEALVPGLSCTMFRPKVILTTPAFSQEVLSRAATVSADGVLDSRDPGEVAASVAAHLRS